jgi:hypothetical protein
MGDPTPSVTAPAPVVTPADNKVTVPAAFDPSVDPALQGRRGRLPSPKTEPLNDEVNPTGETPAEQQQVNPPVIERMGIDQSAT